MRPRSESAEQTACKRLYQLAGCHVYDFSQGYRPGGRRHGSSRQTPGIPDLLIRHVERKLSWWHEVKADAGSWTGLGGRRESRRAGKQSAAQREFQILAEECGETYLLGGAAVALAFLEEHGLLTTWRPNCLEPKRSDSTDADCGA